jgi:hypothetical protein
MVKKIALSLFVLGLCATDIARAQGVTTSSVPFLLIAPNSRASAMGESGVAMADDAWAIYWNPAGFAFQQGSEVAMTHANWLPAFGLSDLWIAHLVYKQPVEQLDGIIAAGLTYLNLGEFNRTGPNSPDIIGTFKAYEFAFTVGYGTKLSEQLGLGINARIIHSSLSPFGAGEEQGTGVATGFSFDFGLLYRPAVVRIPFTGLDIGHRLNLGVNLSNIGPKLTYIDKAQADPLPMDLRLGLAYKILESEYNNLSFEMEFSRLLIKRDSISSDEFYKAIFTTWTGSSLSEQLRQFTSAFGLEYWYGSPKLIALRMGYFYEDPRAGNRKFMTFGAGIRYDIYGFDFGYIDAFEDQDPLGGTLRFSLSISWGGESR